MAVSHRGTIVLAFVLGALLLGGAPVLVQTRVPQDPRANPEVPPEFAQILRAQAVLFEIIPRVLEENPDLEVQRVALAAAQEKAMLALDPATARRKARLAELEKAYNAAAALDPVPDLGALMREGRQLRGALEATAARARRQPALAAPAGAFVAALRPRLKALETLDPEIVRLIAESELLLEFVSTAMLLGR